MKFKSLIEYITTKSKITVKVLESNNIFKDTPVSLYNRIKAGEDEGLGEYDVVSIRAVKDTLYITVAF